MPLSSLSLAILGLLSMQPMSGYDLRRAFDASALGRFSSSPGAIYPALARLEASGWVAAMKSRTPNARGRTPYVLTREGRAALEAHLRGAVTDEDVAGNLDHLMLRFSFMGMLPLEASRTFLRHLVEALERYLSDLEGQLDAFPDLPVPQPRLALASGVAGVRATLAWAREALATL